MTLAVETLVAEAVVAHLKAATFSQAFTPVRSRSDWDLDVTCAPDRINVDVAVVPMEQKAGAATRGGQLRYTVPILICIRRKFDQDKLDIETGQVDQAEIDALTYLTQEVFESFVQVRLAEYPEATLMEPPRIGQNPDFEDLRKNQFTSLVALQFNAYKVAASQPGVTS